MKEETSNTTNVKSNSSSNVGGGQNLKCDYCDQIFTKPMKLRTHVFNDHDDGEEVIKKPRLSLSPPKKSQTPPKLELLQPSPNPFLCQICNFSTTTENEILAHNLSDEHLDNFIEFFKNGGRKKNVTKFEFNINSKIVERVGQEKNQITDLPIMNDEIIKNFDFGEEITEPKLVIDEVKSCDQFAEDETLPESVQKPQKISAEFNENYQKIDDNVEIPPYELFEDLSDDDFMNDYFEAGKTYPFVLHETVVQFDFKCQEFQQVMNSYKLFNIVEFIMTKCITMSDSVEWVSEHKKPKDLDRAKNMDEIVLQTLAFVKFIIVPHKFQNLSKLMNEIVNKVFLKWMVTEKQKREKSGNVLEYAKFMVVIL